MTVYADALTGRFLGDFPDITITDPINGFRLDVPAPVPEGGIVVPFPPDAADAIWDGSAWQPGPQTIFFGKVGAGLTIGSTVHPELAALWRLDDVTLTQIQALAAGVATGFGFPGGASTFDYPDYSGVPHALTETSVVLLYRAMRDYLYALQTALATLLAGFPADWPRDIVYIPKTDEPFSAIVDIHPASATAAGSDA
jgi:hypothetical protein